MNNKEGKGGMGLPIIILLYVVLLLIIAFALRNHPVALWATIIPLLVIAIVIILLKLNKAVPLEKSPMNMSDETTSGSTVISYLLVFLLIGCNAVVHFAHNRILSYIEMGMSAIGLVMAALHFAQFKKKKRLKVTYITEIVAALAAAILLPGYLFFAAISDGPVIVNFGFIMLCCLCVGLFALIVFFAVRSVRKYKAFKKTSEEG